VNPIAGIRLSGALHFDLNVDASRHDRFRDRKTETPLPGLDWFFRHHRSLFPGRGAQNLAFPLPAANLSTFSSAIDRRLLRENCKPQFS
jgi:hypothetical protein